MIKKFKMRINIKVSDICSYVQKIYGIRYSVSGMTDWLKRHNFTFHQPCGLPAKADAAAQEKFIEDYEKLKNTLPGDDHSDIVNIYTI